MGREELFSQAQPQFPVRDVADLQAVVDEMYPAKLPKKTTERSYSLASVRELPQAGQAELLLTLIEEDGANIYTRIVTRMMEDFSANASGRQEIDVRTYSEEFGQEEVEHVLDQLIELGLVTCVEKDKQVSCGYLPSRKTKIEQRLMDVYIKRYEVLNKRLEEVEGEIVWLSYRQDTFWSNKKSVNEMEEIHTAFQNYHDTVAKMPILQLQQWIDLLQHLEKYEGEEVESEKQRIIQEIQKIFDSDDLIALIQAIPRPRGANGHSDRDQERVYSMLENLYEQGTISTALVQAIEAAAVLEKEEYDFDGVEKSHDLADQKQQMKHQKLADLTGGVHLLKRRKELLLDEIRLIKESWIDTKDEAERTQAAA